MRGPASICSVGMARIGLGVVLHRFERDLGLQAVGFLVERAHALQPLADARLRHRLPGVDQPAAELGGPRDLLLVHFEVPFEHRCCEARTGAGVDLEVNVDLLVVLVGLPIEYGTHLSLEQAVAFQQALLVFDSRLQLLVGERLSEVELRRVFQLTGVGRTGDVARRAQVADEPTVAGDEHDGAPVAIGLGIHLDVGIAPGGEQAVDAGAHLRDVERGVHLEGQDVVQLGGFERLPAGLELNVADHQAFELLVLG